MAKQALRAAGNPADLDAVLGAIASKHLFVETLATRNSDSLDFHDVNVAGLKAALAAAYAAGQAAR